MTILLLFSLFFTGAGATSSLNSGARLSSPPPVRCLAIDHCPSNNTGTIRRRGPVYCLSVDVCPPGFKTGVRY